MLAALADAGLTDSTRVVYTSDHGDNLGARGLWGKSTMYEELVGVPLIAAGPGLPAGHRVTTPANLLDLYPFIMECAGEVSSATVTAEHPGTSMASIIANPDASRAVFSEYHGMGSKTAAYMVRKGPYKLVYYADYPPQLFDLASDPEELNDIAGQANARPVVDELTAELHRICDPHAVDRQAKADQARKLDRGRRQGLRHRARRSWLLTASRCAGPISARLPQLFRKRTPPPKPGMRLTATITADVKISMVRPSTAMAARSPLSLRSKISTDSTLVCDVNRITAADSSRTTATKMKHQVAIMLGPSSGAVMSRKRAQARGAENARGFLQLRRERMKRRLQLLVGGRQLDRQIGEQ